MRVPGPRVVAMDQVPVCLGHIPEPWLCAAVAAVRLVLRLRLPQVRSLRRSATGTAQEQRNDRDTRRLAARAARAGAATARRSRAAGVQRLSGRARQKRRREAEQDDRMTTPETPGAPAPAVTVEKIRTALLGYRIMAWTTGIWLIALCYEIVSHLAFHHEIRWIEVVHGWVYFVYVLAAFNLAIKVRWPVAKTIGVLLAGTIPLLGIIVEHFQTKDVKARFGL